ncbi:MAG: TetR/AcrR family transcriptional regulator [Salinisphaera sp.]|nr:TetR/AcrR family transcriptional regulator [Salinisphaera sp.]
MPDTANRQPRCNAANPRVRRILSAAQGSFASHGYSTASMDAIADKAGVSKATVYAHFDSKERLFEAVVIRECEDFLQRLEIPADVEQMPLRPALQRIAANFLELILTTRALSIYRIAIAESRRFPRLGSIFYESGPNLMLASLTRYLDSARHKGMTPTANTRLAAYQFLGMLRGDLHLRAMLGLEQPPRESIELVAEQAVDTFLAAYGSRDADLSRHTGPGAG